MKHHALLYLFRTKQPLEKGIVLPEDKPSEKATPDVSDAVLCRQCLHVITSFAERHVVDGAHMHTFANPSGIVYEIACYKNAWGCGYVGPASMEFTWFGGHSWRIAVCGSCHVHIGWHFSASTGTFFHGLITSRLIMRYAHSKK